MEFFFLRLKILQAAIDSKRSNFRQFEMLELIDVASMATTLCMRNTYCWFFMFHTFVSLVVSFRLRGAYRNGFASQGFFSTGEGTIL